MIYTGYEILWLFFAGSFGGWCLETVRAAFKRKRFVNRGLVNGPFCVIYGIVLVALTLFYRELPLFWLFCGAAILGTVVEWIAGHLIEQMWHERWWDYSDVKWNLDGYICLPMSMLWGALGLITVRWGNGLMVRLFRLFPDRIQGIVIWALVIGIAVDIAATVIIISGKSGSLRRWERIDRWFTGVSLRIGRRIYRLVEGRIDHAYPRIRTVREKERSEAFAAGCCFYKIMWLFVIGSFLGDITETIFCRLKAGVGDRHRRSDRYALPVQGQKRPLPVPYGNRPGRGLRVPVQRFVRVSLRDCVLGLQQYPFQPGRQDQSAVLFFLGYRRSRMAEGLLSLCFVKDRKAAPQGGNGPYLVPYLFYER